MSINDLARKIILGYRASSESYIKHLRKIGMRIGEDVHIYSPMNTIIDEQRPYMIEIGNHVNITTGVKILAHGYDWSVLKANTGKVYGSAGIIKIGDNVFIGMNTVILKDVQIGNNVIIGAGSVVTKSIPDNSVAVGNPAKVVSNLEDYEKKREKQQIEEAYNMYKSYYECYDKVPPKEIFDEFFFIFTNNKNEIWEKCYKQMRNMGNFEKSMKVFTNNKPLFNNYDDFCNYCEERRKRDLKNEQ